MKIHLLFLCFLFQFYSFASENVIVQHQFSHLTFESSTCFMTEEINRNLIIGEYFNRLLEESRVNKTIQLKILQGNLEDEGIYVSRNFQDHELSIILIFGKVEIDQTLYVLNFILNDFLRDQLKKNSPYEWENQLINPKIKDVLGQKVYRPTIMDELGFTENFTYYFQNDSFFIEQTLGKNTKVVLTIPSIHQIKAITNHLLVVITEERKALIYESSYNPQNPKITTEFNFPNSSDRCINQFNIGFFSNHILFSEYNNSKTDSFSMDTKEFKENIQF